MLLDSVAHRGKHPAAQESQPKPPPAPDAIALAAGAACAALGIAVMAGWHLGNPRLTQVYPGLTPMAYNTAAAFLALGLAWVALSFGWRWMARAAAAFAALLGFAHLLQYATGFPAGLESILLPILPPRPLLPPIKMAPNTAIGLVLAAIGILFRVGARRRPAAIAFCGSAAAALGLSAFLGYWTGLPTYLWGRFTPMSLHTSAGLITLGVALVVVSWRQGERGARRSWAAVVVAMAGGVTAFSLWRALSTVETLHLEAAVPLRSSLPEVVLAFTLALATLLAVTVYLAQTARMRAASAERLRGEAERAVEALATGERKYRILLENLPQKIACKDRDSVYLSCNQNYARDLGIAPEAIAGKTDYEFFSKDLADKYRADDRRVMDSGETAEIEEEYVIQGQRQYVQTVKTPVRNEAGAVTGVIVIWWDVSARKRAEDALAGAAQALEAEKRRFAGVLDKLPAYVVLRAPDYYVPFANRFFRERFGESRGRRCFEYLFGRAEPCENCESFQPLKTGAPHHWEWLGPDQRYYDRYDFPFTEPDGATLILEMGIDITERKRAELELSRVSAYNRSLIEASLDPLVTIAPDGKITDVNRATETITGCGRDRLIGSDFCDYFTDPEKARKGYQQVFREGSVQDYELEVRRGSGKPTPVLYNASVYRDETGAIGGVFAAARDITERKRAEQALEEKARDLARSNADLEQFAYVASHDLQEPLRMVANFTQLLADRYRNQVGAEGAEFIAYAVDGATRMQTLIQDLLMYSRVGTRGRSFEPTDCTEILGQAVANLQVAIRETGALVSHSELPVVRADASQFLQLLQNLIGNAIKFRAESPPRVHVSAARQGASWQFSVRDNGIGIDPRFADRIFVIFQRLHSRGEYPGTGIGLALCKKIVERHGGRIWVESEPGKGSTFHFTLTAG